MGTLGEGRASGNWQRLQKVIGKSKPDASSDHARKRRKLSHSASTPASETTTRSPAPASILPIASTSSVLLTTDSEPPSREVLDMRALISAPTPHHPTLPEKHRLPGQYIAVDCEMVGVGPLGSESSLARVSIVNYHGAVLCDLFVRQKERVTDWRTRWSGIRETDMIGAKPFEEVQTTVSSLMKDRILIGHAVHNDLQALLLSHPRAQLRDTQVLARKHGQSRVKHPSLKNLVRDMLGVAIQEGEHSSVIDARATMAVFRLHRKEWERPFAVKGVRVPISEPSVDAEEEDNDDDDEGHADAGGGARKRETVVAEEPGLQLHLASAKTSAASKPAPAAASISAPRKKKAKTGSAAADGRRGISSGLSTVVTRRSKGGAQDTQVHGRGATAGGGAKRKGGSGGGGTEKDWWKVL
ncbi:ribonuclease H-like protein [Dentipellis sp. KUC8613]|nr:ribonuclease H-like protein [Dentipellis sp. KUC8613]